MATFTSTPDVGGALPPQYGKLVTQPVDQASVAIQASTLVTTDRHDYHVPIVTEDASAAWVAEGQEIPVSDPTLAELVVTPAKLAGLVNVSSELAEDSSPAALKIMGDSLGRDIARKLDAAFFGTAAAPAPAGLPSLVGRTTIQLPTGSTAWTNLDPFAEAITAAEQEGATLTSFVANPDDALSLATLKEQDGSNVPLLGSDPAVAGARTVLGVPLLVSPAVTPGTVWGIPREFSLVVRRKAVRVESSPYPLFSSDMVSIRAIMRVTWAHPHPASVIEIRLAAS